MNDIERAFVGSAISSGRAPLPRPKSDLDFLFLLGSMQGKNVVGWIKLCTACSLSSMRSVMSAWVEEYLTRVGLMKHCSDRSKSDSII